MSATYNMGLSSIIGFTDRTDAAVKTCAKAPNKTPVNNCEDVICFGKL